MGRDEANGRLISVSILLALLIAAKPFSGGSAFDCGLAERD